MSRVVYAVSKPVPISLIIEYRLIKEPLAKRSSQECPLQTTSLNLHKLVDQWSCVIMNYSMSPSKRMEYWREVFNKRRHCINSDVRFKLIFYRNVYSIESKLPIYQYCSWVSMVTSIESYFYTTRPRQRRELWSALIGRTANIKGSQPNTSEILFLCHVIYYVKY